MYIYASFEPKDDLLKIKWLFDDHHALRFFILGKGRGNGMRIPRLQMMSGVTPFLTC